jgi:hypothetical protein
MNIQELINKRKSLSYAQETSLIDLLTYRCGSKTKEKMKEVIRNKFYSSFDKKEFSKYLEIGSVEVSWFPPKAVNITINEVRKELLK